MLIVPSIGEHEGQLGHIIGGIADWYCPSDSLAVYYKFKHTLMILFSLSNFYFWNYVYEKWIKTVHTKTFMWTFTVVLFKLLLTIYNSNVYKLLKSIHTMQYYSAIKRNTLLLHASTWMNLKGSMLRSGSTYYVILFIWHSWKGKAVVMG